MPAEQLYVGLMSGTSMDGIDAVLADFGQKQPTLIGHLQHTYPPDLRNQLAVLCQPGENEIDRLGEADIQVAEAFAEATLLLLRKVDVNIAEVKAIGSHGQTLRHRPGFKHPFTLQIDDPNTLAQETGITTVADFRRRDMAAGGQGAPLAPAFHKAIFQHSGINRVILNIGGIANITYLPANATETLGFDTGPGNTLLDHWVRKHQSVNYDANGHWAASGEAISDLLAQLISDPYFSLQPPKSTGTDYFNLAWLEKQFKAGKHATKDVQATLSELSAQTISDAVVRYCPGAAQVLVCGGGVHNRYLMERLSAHLPGLEVNSTASLGIDPDWIEAMAFAWLAKRTLEGIPGNLPSVTGAQETVVLGGIYPQIKR